VVEVAWEILARRACRECKAEETMELRFGSDAQGKGFYQAEGLREKKRHFAKGLRWALDEIPPEEQNERSFEEDL